MLSAALCCSSSSAPGLLRYRLAHPVRLQKIQMALRGSVRTGLPLSYHPRVERDDFFFRKPQPELRAPPDHILCCLREFMHHQIAHLALSQRLAEVTAEFSH